MVGHSRRCSNFEPQNKPRAELQRRGPPPTFAGMQGKWKRFGAFIAAVVAIIGAITFGTRGQSLSTAEVIALVALVGVLAYLLTFAVWPRKLRSSTRHAAAGQPEMAARNPGLERHPRVERPVVDERPVAVIQPRPAGSRPGSRVHIPESPLERNPRGRRRDSRQPDRDFQWPAQR